MFLKRIELQGFKSFMDKTIITFDSDVIGFVIRMDAGKVDVSMTQSAGCLVNECEVTAWK